MCSTSPNTHIRSKKYAALIAQKTASQIIRYISTSASALPGSRSIAVTRNQRIPRSRKNDGKGSARLERFDTPSGLAQDQLGQYREVVRRQPAIEVVRKHAVLLHGDAGRHEDVVNRRGLGHQAFKAREAAAWPVGTVQA